MKTTLPYPIMLDPIVITKQIIKDEKGLVLDISNHPSATLAGIVIETESGKKNLPFSPEGIRKIEWEKDFIFIYFGKNLPAYSKVWIYLQKIKP